MRAWIAILVSILTVAGAVLYASESQRSTAELNFSEARIGEELRASMLDAELALGQTLAGSERLEAMHAARAQFTRTYKRALTLTIDDPEEQRLLRQQDAAVRGWDLAARDDLTILRPHGAGDGDEVDDRVTAINDFLAANARFRARLQTNRQRETSGTALIPVFIVIALSAVFALAGGIAVRRARRHDRALAEAEEHRRQSEMRFQASQRRLNEALQVAGDRPEAHTLLQDHLETTIPGSSVYILNRNNSADRLEASPAVAVGSPLAEPLASSTPRSCIAVRLSRPYERDAQSDEVLSCELCGKLPGETSCRPLLVAGEVIGSVLVEREGKLDDGEVRRIDDSVTAAAPVLANLRNLEVAETRAATDALTGLPNRRALDDEVKRMLAHAARSMQPLAVVLIDLDRFKDINDTFGHERGDSVLAAFGALLGSEMRASDFAARFGGEEFVALLPDTDAKGAVVLADKLRRAVPQMPLDGVTRRVTASFGVAVFPHDAADEEGVLRLADRALYAAKRNGRDRVEVAEPQADRLPRPWTSISPTTTD